MKLVVTGGSGTLGRSVCSELVRRGHFVRCLYRTSRPSEQTRTEVAIEFQKSDVTEGPPLVEAFAGMDAVVHLAAITDVQSSPTDIYRTNALGTFSVYNAALEAGIKTVVNSSSINALGLYFSVRPVAPDYLPVDEDHPCRPSDPYSFTKRSSEAIADYFHRREGIGGASLRIPMGFVYEEKTEWLSESFRVLKQVFGRIDRSPDRKAWAKQFGAKITRYRENRVRERGSRQIEFSPDERTLFAWTYNLLCVLDSRDLVQAILAAANCGDSYHGPLHLGSSINFLGIDPRRVVEVAYPETVVDGSMERDSPLVSIDRARSTLSWSPELTDNVIRRLWREHGRLV